MSDSMCLWMLAYACSLLVGGSLLGGCSGGTAVSLPAELPEVLRPVQYDTLYAESKVDRRPRVKGGMEAIVERLDYPADVPPRSVDSHVVVQFVVSPEGRATNVEVAQQGYPPLEREALKTILAAEYRPGQHQGEAVPVIVSIPCFFGP